MPGRRTGCCCCEWLFWWGWLRAGRGSGPALLSCEEVMTWLRRLFGAVKLLLSGCHVLRRQASSAALLAESRRACQPPAVDVVGEPPM